ncbi:MAG: hypothetical protein CGU28_09175 [Candidatus Dactylopiibacterium carminicum]|uniref:GGDEF domain-containing protein n=1 Tax=Candidatus Dactylopiibacterium carminicum TaxID=857335 RepID=A0A272ERW8_9RHOO|nr:hypothetical protein [Candidatus Dactylopiibacterium carminicum]KAF7598951.1 hypothetical protein BGI27_10430 [Candidatus Dactylopiibacterium carminicum]PAS92863.1 MAG: hypothetical protein CGU29_09965 [Candidatus Dactylopiibacterium carminicum]PAS96368.1 MAG: hypothetical protein CGU28_09175 [Candidatus Dactylopiibacterium carminicum]
MARLLVEACDPRDDFIGHIGGDDFLVLFQSTDWQQRCEAVLGQFGQRVPAFCSSEDIARDGILSEDRQGRQVVHCLPSLSIGALAVPAGCSASHHEISAMATEAKRQAKRTSGNTLFIERRGIQTQPTQAPAE